GEGGTIGRPIANARVYILSESLHLQPAQAVGEICIGGAGVARGYLNQPPLPAEKFIANPWVAGARLYRSGDLGRWLPNGEIVFMGRRDEQVKIRGYRVEPGEVENALRTCPGVGQAAVKVVGTGEAAALAAYFTADRVVTPAGLRQWLRRTLPEYMVPAYLVRLEQMPLSPNGKIDRRALPEPGAAEAAPREGYAAPRNPTEAQLAALWEEVLGLGRVGIHDNFFTIGGHSLNALRILTAIHKRLEVHLSLKEIFRNPTISGLAGVIASARRSAYRHLPVIEEQEHYAVSHTQRGLWVQHQYHERMNAYNVPGAYVLEGPLDVPALEAALHELAGRHESLRTTFVEVAGEPRQRVHPPGALPFRLACLDLTGDEARSLLPAELAAQEAAAPFDLEKGPLLRAKLIRTAPDRHVFLFTIHHLVADGWSLQLLAREVVSGYNARLEGRPGPLLPPLGRQYKDYTAWQAKRLAGPAARASAAFWQQKVQPDVPVLNLPADFARPALKTFNSDAVRLDLPAPLSDRLPAFAVEHGVSLYAVLVGSVKVMLHCYSGQHQIAVGMADSGRLHGDLEEQIGYYLNMLVLRDELGRSDTLLEVMQKAHRTILEALEHKEYPFELLIESLGRKRDLTRNPFFDVEVAFTRFNRVIAGDVGSMKGIEVSLLHTESNSGGKFDLDFLFSQEDDDLRLLVFYNKDLFRRSTVAGMVESWQLVAEHLLKRPDLSLPEFVGTWRHTREEKQAGLKQTLRTSRLEKLAQLKK
ncbi:MAG: AMP-binding protein, partial [Cytophagales bacterium]|nr:AMP-binding protein [Cytophagales bacterium]